MGIDIEQYIQPIDIALQKLNTNDGAAGNVQNELSQAASAFSGHAASAKGHAVNLTAEWEGGKGTTFAGKAGAAPKELDNAAQDAQQVAQKIGDAMATIKAAKRQIQQLKDEFESKARAIARAAQASNQEGKATSLLHAMGAKYSNAAAKILQSAKGALAGAAGGAATTGSTGPSSAGAIGSRTAGSASSSGGGGGAGGGSYSGGGGGGGSSASTGKAQFVPPPKNNYNNGSTQVKLPDGKTVNAPNPRAAAALRAALSRKGLPYVWGGTDPNKGMDCSGLTQWAYGQAGVKLPRTAHTQTIGQKVSFAQKQPGDLLIWSGHVAMYIGDGQIIEEPQPGETCHIRPVRTDNCGEPFLGVFRPSA